MRLRFDANAMTVNPDGTFPATSWDDADTQPFWKCKYREESQSQTGLVSFA